MSKTYNYLILVVLTAFCHQSQCAKILGVFPMGARSHYILGNALMKGLAEQGHDVTLIGSFEDKVPPKQGTYKEIVLTGFIDKHEEMMKFMNIFNPEAKSVMFMLSGIHNLMIQITENVLNHPNVQKLLQSDEKFDLVIVEEMQLDALKGFADHYNSPLVLLSTLGANQLLNNLIGNPQPLSYIPHLILGLKSDMTFFQRVKNVLFYMLGEAMRHLYSFPKQAALAKKYFPNNKDLKDIVYNNSLVLLNSHSSTNQAVPYVPMMIDIGGFHINPPKKLPDKLQILLDNAKNGVIYFSLGSHLKSTYLPTELRNTLLKTFSQLKETVLWKWEDEELPGKPDNVHIAKWMPQQDILAHPNIKLFITHSGLLSTLETIYHGVPILAIPLVGDQKINAVHMENSGIGLKLDFLNMTEEILLGSIQELIVNPKFAENAKTKSRFFHDRQVSPLETAVYWVEYVLRHGTSHLRVAGLDLPWYQYQILDVLGFLFIVNFIICYVFVKILKKFVFKKKTEKSKRQGKLKRT